MSSPDPLERLLDLDRSSREFPSQLANILLMEDCMNRAQTLPYNGLMKFVEDLDRVCVQITFIRSLLTAMIGPRRSRPYRAGLLSLSFRTLEALWRPKGLTGITHALGGSC